MHRRSHRSWIALAPMFAATILASCAEETTTGPRIATLVQVSGGGQQGPIGATLTQPLIIRVEDQSGQPVPGSVIFWAVVSGGGSVTPSQSTTDPDGYAQASLRLGTAVGVNSVSATLGTLQPLIFTATATAAPPSKIVIQAGEGQTATVGTLLANDLLVKVTDAVDNPKPGVLVTFAIGSGAGSLTTITATTDASGFARTKWTLGNLSGIQTVIVAVTGVAPAVISATARAAGPQVISILNGNNQTALPGAALPDSIRVRVIDGFGNPVSGVAITWTPRANGGSASPTSSVTDANGRAATKWTLGAVGGPMIVDAAGGGLSIAFQAGGLVNFTTISAGGRNTCAVSFVKVLFCWGYNGEGQLGIGQPALGSGPVFAYPQPSASAGSLTFREVVTSLYHACGITLASVGYCWGVNHDGRLGNGTLAAKNVPTQIGGGADPGAHSYRVLGVSLNHTCGISLADRIFCWGYGRDGQLGNGGAYPGPDAVKVPVEVSGDRRFSTMSAGGLHTCAITNGGETFCWGVNLRGELGDGTTADRFDPTLVGGGLSFTSVAAGFTHTCALTSAGAAWCWGGNASGQLGTGLFAGSSLPVGVTGALAFTSITAGNAHTCGLTAAGALFCWGSNAKGQIGDGSLTTRPAPTAVGAGLIWQAVSAGETHTCGVTTSNLAYCWGDNQFGQLGDGSQVDRLLPTKVAFQP